MAATTIQVGHAPSPPPEARVSQRPWGLIGLAVNGFQIPSQDVTHLVSALEANPGAIAASPRCISSASARGTKRT